ncbi:hypothetical protein [Persicobacter diffluens]|uniref:Uncharacterized protein n=1 Tax=Persicobacter diffluens TaxID=981 RepID=A0AAN5APJ5_9BACT|nr:hypothetical protein PEDI_49430 [Persicobacter diffluens]
MKIFNLYQFERFALLFFVAVFFVACSDSTTVDNPDPGPDPEPECEVQSPEALMISVNGEEVPMNEGKDLSEFDKRIVLGGKDASLLFMDDAGNSWGTKEGEEDALEGDLMVKTETCGENSAIEIKDAGDAKVAVVNAHIDNEKYKIEIEDQNFCFDFDWDYTAANGDVKKIWMIGVVNTVKGQMPEAAWGKGVAMTQNADNPALWEADIWAYNPWQGDDDLNNTPLDNGYQFMLVYNANGVWGDEDGTVSLDWGIEKGAEQDLSETSGDFLVKAFVKDNTGKETVNECSTAIEFEEDGEMKIGNDAVKRDFPGSADKGVHFTFNVETLKYSFKLNE